MTLALMSYFISIFLSKSYLEQFFKRNFSDIWQHYSENNPNFLYFLNLLAEIGHSAPISARSGSLLSKAAKDKAMAAN